MQSTWLSSFRTCSTSLMSGGWLRFLALRKQHVTALAKNPKAKPRHERVDISLFTKKTEEDYVDVKKDVVSDVFWNKKW